MIKITSLHVGYAGKPVLKGVDAVFESGKIHGLIGLNGSGKTTLLRCMYGALKPEAGNVEVRVSAVGRSMAFLEAEQYFYHHITGEEYLKLLRTDNSFDIEPWLDVFSLPGNVLIDEYSTGMKKKLAFIGIVASSRPILLLDEPFNGLDMESSRVLSKVLLKMRQSGKTIVLTSHILGSLIAICDNMLLLKDGKVQKTFGDFVDDKIESEVFRELDEQLDIKLSRLPGI